MSSGNSYGAELLRRQLLELSRNPPEGMTLERLYLLRDNVILYYTVGVSVGLGDDENIFSWELMIVGPSETLYEGGKVNIFTQYDNAFVAHLRDFACRFLFSETGFPFRLP